uniref:Uncharacterized protein n=1 Tax=Oncorhynchus kisutch TaxID=8019 RepID=A0A8C7M629_ONCKI
HLKCGKRSQSSRGPNTFARHCTSLSVSLSEALMEELNQGLRPLKQNAEKKFCSRSMHVNNNNIITDFNNMSHLGSTCPSTTSHTAVLVELKELRVLYRHDKSICNLSEVDKLGALPFLHGSTMENEGSYRYTHTAPQVLHAKGEDKPKSTHTHMQI